jgi:two-component system, LytTR family, sensor kinase
MPNIYQRIIFGKNKKYGLFRRITIVLMMSLLSSVCRMIAVPTLPFSWHLYTFFVFTVVLMLMWECFRFINKFLDQKLPYEKGILKRIIVQLLLGIILISNLRKIWVYWFMSFAPKEIMDLVPLNTMMIYMFYFIDILISILINANFIVLHFFEEWQKSLIKNERLQKERAQVR